ncbi:MAG: hypothetical protein H6741_03685 [Alphaproteobacteria bacterium]|nr:hypothetical protein [Alphaproteobacteria bacterium]
MADLRVTVRYNDAVVEDRTLSVRSVVRLGDSKDAEVSFPGTSVTVARVAGHLDIRGRRLAPGESTDFSLGPVSVVLEHVEPIKLTPLPKPPLDPRFLMVAMGVTVAGMWLDLGAELLARPPVQLVEMIRYVGGDGLGVPVSGSRPARERVAATVRPNEPAAVVAVSPIAGEGPEAQSDDGQTQMAFYPWYRQAVPTDLEAEIARYRLKGHAGDPALHALVARGAYEGDSYREALEHYQLLVEMEPGNIAWWQGLASTQKRLGLHVDELRSWDAVLRLDRSNLIARGNRAVTLARLGDYEGAERALAHLRMHRDSYPYVNVYFALYDAIRGREQSALQALDLALSARTQLPEAMQIELRRDLAIDPVLRPLRGGSALRIMLYRHFGAAAPRPLR